MTKNVTAHRYHRLHR